MSIQQGDIILYQSLDGGEIQINNGLIEMNGGLQTAAYLSLFGGNEDDNGLNENLNKSWWGNQNEDKIYQYRSETQYLLKGLPATSSNLRKLELVALNDLNWMIDYKLADKINVTASIPLLNMVKLNIQIDQKQFEFIENWRNQ